MIERLRHFFGTFLLFELVKGMALTGRPAVSTLRSRIRILRSPQKRSKSSSVHKCILGVSNH